MDNALHPNGANVSLSPTATARQESPIMPRRILIVEDHDLTRHGASACSRKTPRCRWTPWRRAARRLQFLALNDYSLVMTDLRHAAPGRHATFSRKCSSAACR